MRCCFSLTLNLIFIALSVNSFAEDNSGHTNIQNASPQDKINEDLIFETLPGKSAQLYHYNPESKKCEDFLDENGKVILRYYVSPKETPTQIPKIGQVASSNEEQETETNTIIVIDTLYEQRNLKVKDFLIIRDSSQFENGEDILYCIRKSSFKGLTGKTYTHKALFEVKDNSDLPGPGRIPLIDYKVLNTSLSKAKNLKTNKEHLIKGGEEIGIIKDPNLPASLKTPAGTLPFFLVSDTTEPKTIYYHSAEELYKKSRDLGVEETIDPKEHQQAADLSNSYLSLVKKKILNPAFDFKENKVNIGLSKTKRNGKYLIQFPVKKEDNSGPCGSYHYLPHSPKGADAFASPTTSCLFSAALQDWKKNYCPDSDKGCRVAWGDISHVSIQEKTGSTWPHSEHNLGLCIDVRPLKKGSFEDKGLVWGSGTKIYTRRKKRKVLTDIKNRSYNDEYDQEKTKELVGVFRAWGATKVLFNDNKACGTSLCSGHDNHIHVCFDESRANKMKCLEEVKIDKNYCPELASNVDEVNSPWLYKWSPEK